MHRICPHCQRTAKKHPNSSRCVDCFKVYESTRRRANRAKNRPEIVGDVGRPPIVQTWANDLSTEYLRMKL
jgi:hypothetical protein